MNQSREALLWSTQYRLVSNVIAEVAPDLAEMGLEAKELFVLASLDEHPHPAEVAATLCMPKPTVTLYVKRLEASGHVRREIDTSDLRKHRLTLTASGRKAMTRGMTLLTEAFGKRLGRLGPKQQAELQALLERLV